MKNKPLIMFDFDGVIVDTLGISFAINQETNPQITLEDYKNYFNGNIYDSFKDLPKKENDEFHKRFEEETRMLTVPEDIKTLLRKYAETHVLAIISGSLTSTIEAILEREGVRDCFRDVMGYDVDPSKAVRIKMLLKKYGVKSDDTVFITDTSGDVYEATECEVASIAVTWGFQSKDTLADAIPMALVDTVAQLDDAIEMFFSA